MKETYGKSRRVVVCLRKAVGSVVTSESYIFANGTRFDGEALRAAPLGLIRQDKEPRIENNATR
jgi:hypothetical protein